MGILAVLEPHHHQPHSQHHHQHQHQYQHQQHQQQHHHHYRAAALPDTPPPFGSPTSSSLSRPDEQLLPPSWIAPKAPISPPMSHYDSASATDMSTAGKSAEDGGVGAGVGAGAGTGAASSTTTAAGTAGASASVGDTAATPTTNRSESSAPRQQLPSLSSLFGPPSSVRPLSSPMSERQPPFSGPSSTVLDRPRAPPSQAERNFSTPPYLQQHQHQQPSLAPRSTYDPKFDAVEQRAPVQPLIRSFSGPGSPRYREPDPRALDSRSDTIPAARWPLSHQENGRSEAPPPLRSPHERGVPMQFSTSRDSMTAYRDPRPLPTAPPSAVQPPTPTSTVVSEGLSTSKDGLGPKIWTGTHFLPRFVRAAEVPGEGMCYFYDDGSHCKSVIDGEAVNAHWGVTKAGKPRKRLAIACVTCREKKIKCDPDYPRCVQCEKFGRVCKFKNAPRGGHNTSPSTPPAEPDDWRRLGPGPPVPPVPPKMPDLPPRPLSSPSSSVSPRTALRNPSPEPPSKRPRLSYEAYSSRPAGSSSTVPATPTEPVPYSPAGPGAGVGPGMASSVPRSAAAAGGMAEPGLPRPGLLWQPQMVELPRIHEDVLHRAWQADPYVSDPQSITSVLSSFFVHLDSTPALRFLPEAPFTSRMTNAPITSTTTSTSHGLSASNPSSSSAHAHPKSPEDMMLAYSVLAAGVALQSGPPTIANEYAQVGCHAQRHIPPCLQLVQARLLLALYFLSAGRPSDASDMIAAAVSAAAALQLNVALEKTREASLPSFPWGMSREMYAESRIRTYWSCFLLDRLNGMFPLRPAMLNTDDMFIYYPSDCPGFDAVVPGQLRAAGSVEKFLVQVVEIWADVSASIYRASIRSMDAKAAIERQERMQKRLKEWKSSLPYRFSFEHANLEEASASRHLGSLVTMHLLYHSAVMKLHRYVPPAVKLQMSPQARSHQTSLARDEAVEVLDKFLSIKTLASSASRFFPPPCTSFVALEALDVLSARGSVGQLGPLIEKLATARGVVETVRSAWEGARVHAASMDVRMETMARVRDRGTDVAGSSVAGCRVFLAEDGGEMGLAAGMSWEMADAVETTFPRSMDLVYNDRGMNV